MVSTALVCPGNPILDGELQHFATQRVDLGQTMTNYGRSLGQYAIDLFAAKANRIAHLPHVYLSESFIAGSLGRHTQEQPLDDIDVYLVFNGDGTFMSHAGIPDPVTMFGSIPNPLTQQAIYWNGGFTSSTAVLNAFLPIARACVQASNGIFTGAGLGAKGRTLYLTAGGINLDLVLVQLGKGSRLNIDRYYLPDGYGRWRASNPKEDQRRISQINQAQGQALLAIVRMIKWWNRTHNADRLKGIHLEVMIERAIVGWQMAGTFSTIRMLFPALATAVMNNCPDPTGLGANLDSRLTWADRIASRDALNAAQYAIWSAGLFADANMIPAARTELRKVFPI